MSSQLAVTGVAGSTGNDGTRVLKQLIHQSSNVPLTAIVPNLSKKRKHSKGDVAVISTAERLLHLGQVDPCLVTDEEVAAFDQWSSMPDPFHLSVELP